MKSARITNKQLRCVVARRPLALTVALAGAAALAVTACSSSSSSSGSTSGSTGAAAGSSSGCQAPSTVTIAAFAPGVTLSTDMAQGIGAFSAVDKQCNTKVVLQVFQSPQPMLAGLLQGQFQFAVVTAPNLVLQAVQGNTVTDLLNVSQGGTGVIVTGTKDGGKGTGLSGIKAAGTGATWAVTSTGGISSLYANALSQAAGISGAAKVVAVGLAGVVPAVTSGRAPLGYTTAIPAATAISSKQAVEVINASGITAYHSVGFMPGSGLMTTPSVTSQYPALVRAVTVAEIKGMQFLEKNKNNPQAVYDQEPESFKKTTTLATWKASWGWNISAFAPTTGLVTQPELVATAKTMQKYGLIPASFDTSKITSSYADPSNLAAAFKAVGEPEPTQPVDQSALAALPD